MCEVEDLSIPDKDLHTHEDWETLDQKLKVALTGIISGELSMKVRNLTETCAKRKQLCGGRQVLRLIYLEFQKDPETVGIHGFSGLEQPDDWQGDRGPGEVHESMGLHLAEVRRAIARPGQVRPLHDAHAHQR